MLSPPFVVHAEEPQFLVLNKAPELNIHNEGEAAGLITLLREQLNDRELYPVHRLDKATSGLLLVAKGKSATRVLSELFAQRQVAKCYWAIADGKPKKKQGRIVGDLVSARGGSYKLTHGCNNPSRTHFYSYSIGPGRRAYLLKPFTGKTHQLRVALKSLGVPILGDARYGGAPASRLHLHAAAIGFSGFGVSYFYQSQPSSGEGFLASSFAECALTLGSLADIVWPSDISGLKGALEREDSLEREDCLEREDSLGPQNRLEPKDAIWPGEGFVEK